MRIFPMDLFFGLTFLLGFILSLIGLMVFRYRGGKGPAFMTGSGLIFIISAIVWIMDAVELIGISRAIPIAGSIFALILLVNSLILWRGED